MVTVRPSKPTYQGLPKRNKIDVYEETFAALLFIADERREEPKHPSAGEWVNQTWRVHMADRYQL